MTGGSAVQLPPPIISSPHSSAIRVLAAAPDPVAAAVLKGGLLKRLLEAKSHVGTASSTESCCCCNNMGGRDDQACFDDVGGQLGSFPHELEGVCPVRWRWQGTPIRRDRATIITCFPQCQCSSVGESLDEWHQSGTK